MVLPVSIAGMASRYGWIVTKQYDSYDGMKSRVGWVGPRDIPPKIEKALKAGGGVRWRTGPDGDDEPSYEGRFIGNSNSEDAFGPLEDLGTPDVGDAWIQYYKNGKWEWL